ncbi:type I-U CRISPR-associated protein Csb2 [Arthrobacter sp. ov118]|uniref:type I-G CRISPR-associated protein Csb2 n=1 Tax=Arthrobacter sp. ov118 TaxID=1761747 RepID=UPI0008E34BE7|nr:type I-U CRISPR-associated protein Csb2 [Arthrobacter sp. ov118]SFU16287.1 CRISPR-associated protein Csb2 [Arthrobacter sp. ov118]
MSFAIVAEYPLGIYRGSVSEGEADPWPSPARLHAALLSAAALGTNAQEQAGRLHPCDADIEALEWIEANAPGGLVLPNASRKATGVGSFRDIGLLNLKMRGKKRPLKNDHGGAALAGSIKWVWAESPPKQVRERLRDLCPDVPYLGDADSPVRLRIVEGAGPFTHRREPRPALTATAAGAVELAAPRPGRTAALRSAFHEINACKPPTSSADKANTDERERTEPTVMNALGHDRYVPVSAVTDRRSPWTLAWILPIVPEYRKVCEEERVGWCVAAHRALISIRGDDVPLLLTGAYADGVRRPANRVAIQLVDAHDAMAPGVKNALDGGQAFVVAVPGDADPREVEVIARAVDQLRRVTRHGTRSLKLGRAVEIDTTRFWSAPVSDARRTWAATAAVPDGRNPRGGSWTLSDAAKYSVALVFRDHLNVTMEGLNWDQRVRSLAATVVKVGGIDVLAARRLAPPRPELYVHRTQPGVVVTPYTAELDLGVLPGGGRAFIAIGQSRHLGGGLLTPIDGRPQEGVRE